MTRRQLQRAWQDAVQRAAELLGIDPFWNLTTSVVDELPRDAKGDPVMAQAQFSADLRLAERTDGIKTVEREHLERIAWHECMHLLWMQVGGNEEKLIQNTERAGGKALDPKLP